ncbi:MAG: hypothetical protein BWK80_13400, partial [Desulfobacteraceae bacterium IS3]
MRCKRPLRIYETFRSAENGEARCKKPLRSIFALRIYAKNRYALFLHSGFYAKNRYALFLHSGFYAKNRCALFLHSG